MPVADFNLEDTIALGAIDVAPIKSIAIAGTASYITGQKFLTITGFTASEVKKIKEFDCLLINGSLFHVNSRVRLPFIQGIQANPTVIQIQVVKPIVAISTFTGQSIKWAKGCKQSEYPKEGFSLSSASYKVNDIAHTAPLNFKKNHRPVLVEATELVTISSASATAL